MGPIDGASNINENIACLATQKQDQETRGEGEMKIMVLFPSPLHIRVKRNAVRTQHGVSSANDGNANYAGSQYIDHPISFTMVEAPTEEEAFWPFGPTDEPVDISGLFGYFGGVSGEEAGDSLFMVEEEPAQQLGFREHIVRGLTAMIRA